jgi:hypothetical protein
MSMTDYPTPMTDRIATPGDWVQAGLSRQLECEAAAWRAVAEAIHSASNLDELQAAHEAFDALEDELEKP